MHRQRLLLACLLVAWVGMAHGCGRARNPSQPQTETDPEPVLASADKPVRHGNLQIQVTSVTIGKVPLEGLGRKSVSEESRLAIRLELLNENPTKKVEYNSWNDKDLARAFGYVRLTDGFGNRYSRIDFGGSGSPAGSVLGSESIYPNKTLSEVLAFELPVDLATHLDLELPAKYYGSEGIIRIRIPTTMIVRDKTKP